MRMYVACLSFLLLTIIASIDATAAESGRRLALVIGNAQYEAAGTLPNAARDARAFGAFLSAQGFDADIVVDADRGELAEAVSRFSRKITADDVALFYYAGHGMQLHGENYLVATDARLESEFDVAAETLALADVVGAIERKAKIALVFLDACRNNPLANRLNSEIEGATRSLATRGLAPIETESAGTMVAFAAAPGQVASDGSGENSPFTTALISNLAGPGLEIGTAFKRVIRDVRKTTDGKQSPQILSSLALEFYFKPGGAEPDDATVEQALINRAQPLAETPQTEVEIDFQKALRINTPRIWTFFLAKHKTGQQATIARQTLALMKPTVTPTGILSAEQRENALGLDKNQRRDIQIAISGKGFGVGNADGVLGAQTRKAIAAYQKSNGISDTGYLNDTTAKALGINVVKAENGLYSSPVARQYLPKDFEGLETDPRALKAINCKPLEEKVYGSFEGHMYVVIRTMGTPWKTADLVATSCRGHLATISSEAENAFIVSLFSKDDRLFDTNYQASWNGTYKNGPWIGLVQDENGREPKGGWRWVTGEPLTFTKWMAGMPNEDKPDDDFGMFYTNVNGKRDLKDLTVTTWDDMGVPNTTNSYVIEFD